MRSDALAQAARQAWEHHNYDRTISLYEKALRRDPQNYLLLVDLARAYGLRYRIADAEKMIGRALTLHRRSAKVGFLVARTFAMIGRPAQAIDHFERALQLDPQHPEASAALVELAELYEQCRRRSDAQRAVAQASLLTPGRPEVQFRHAVLEAINGQRQEALSHLEQLAARNDVAPKIRSDAWYEIGKLRDQSGDFDAAMAAFQQAKVLLRPQADKLQKEASFLRERHRVMLEQLTPEHFRCWHEMPPASEPQRLALLTGHPRSGTTLIEQVLDGHSQLLSADEYLVMGEFVFRPIAAQQPGSIPTPDALQKLPAEFVRELRQRYWETNEVLLDQPIGGRMLLDKNPSLSYLLPVICRVFPEIKILFALRDPRDVVLSCFAQRLPINAITMNYLSLEATAEKYADAMNYWLTIRPMLACAWLEVRYEDAVADLQRQTRSILQFLGLPWEDQVLDFHTHAQSKQVRSPTFQQVTQPIYRHALGRWRNYQKYLEPVLEKLQPFVEALGYA